VLAAAQPYAWQQAQHRWLIIQSEVALAVLAAAGGFLCFGDSLVSGFAVLAALMLGAALGLPAILERVLSLGQRRARRPLAVWFWADSRQQLSGLSLALMALLLALAVNVGVGTMVESFSRTFTGWLDGRLAADVYLNAMMTGRLPKSARGCAAVQRWRRSRSAGPTCRLAESRLKFSALRITRPIAIAGRCFKLTPTHGTGCAAAMRAWSANSWHGA
jgi:putative ABC transport system permease protein